MDLFLEALAWLFSPEQYQGEGSIPQRTMEHLAYTAGATLIAALVAVPIGYFIGHTGRGGDLGGGNHRSCARSALFWVDTSAGFALRCV